jgi:hypothetical protein
VPSLWTPLRFYSLVHTLPFQSNLDQELKKSVACWTRYRWVSSAILIYNCSLDLVWLTRPTIDRRPVVTYVHRYIGGNYVYILKIMCCHCRRKKWQALSLWKRFKLQAIVWNVISHCTWGLHMYMQILYSDLIGKCILFSIFTEAYVPSCRRYPILPLITKGEECNFNVMFFTVLVEKVALRPTCSIFYSR